jgi:hypothetical protein
MALSPIDIYRDILPQTNCGDCGQSTCLAFAAKVVSEQTPLSECPHLSAETVAEHMEVLQAQYAAGKWTKRDIAADALRWARERAASMRLEDLPERIGGQLEDQDGERVLRLPYFQTSLLIRPAGMQLADGTELTRWEQVFVNNHLAQGGRRRPTGRWKSFGELPNTVSKVKSMTEHVLKPLQEWFSGRLDGLRHAAARMGGRDMTGQLGSADAALLFHPLPRLPVALLFWDQEPEEGFEAEASLLFDETVIEHLDIESIVFLSERLRELLCSQD